jgi:hypothetical protein
MRLGPVRPGQQLHFVTPLGPGHRHSRRPTPRRRAAAVTTTFSTNMNARPPRVRFGSTAQSTVPTTASSNEANRTRRPGWAAMLRQIWAACAGGSTGSSACSSAKRASSAGRSASTAGRMVIVTRGSVPVDAGLPQPLVPSRAGQNPQPDGSELA